VTAEEHNKMVSIGHLAYGAFMTVLMLAMFILMWAMLGARPGVPNRGLPPAFLWMYFAFMLIYTLVFTVPSYIAGYAMLKRKSWARMASIIAAVFEVMSFPLGTAVGIYSFWFMFSDVGKSLYSAPAAPAGMRPYALHDAPPLPAGSVWNARTSYGREGEYVPPAQPPVWRDE
jgi:hypothetical protein